MIMTIFSLLKDIFSFDFPRKCMPQKVGVIFKILQSQNYFCSDLIEETNRALMQNEFAYLDSLKFEPTSKASKKRKDNPVKIKYEANEPRDNNDKEVDKPKKSNKNTKESFQYIYDTIKEMRKDRNAAVDLYGSRRNVDFNAPKDVQNFHILVSLLVSVQNRDESTAKAMNRLKEFGLTVDNIAQTSEEKLLKVLGGVNFNKSKAKNIKRAAEIMIKQYDKKVPMKLDQLLEFPGVGYKIAILLLNNAYNLNIGIGVDTHVHRIANRLEWAHTKTPDQTRLELQSFIPRELWSEINNVVVGFGQQICLPMNPKCQNCSLNDICPTGIERMKALEDIEDTVIKVTKKRKKNNKDDIEVKEEEPSLISTEVGDILTTGGLESPEQDKGKKKKVEKRKKRT